MLVIKHLSGPLAGKEQDISDDRDHVLIGRDSAKCEILYPAEETIVGGEHCQFLRQPSGDWVIERFGDHYVEIDGVAVETRQPLRTGSEIRLGKHSGPSFQVTVTRAPRDGLQRTHRQQETIPVRRLLRRDVGLGLGLLALIVLVIGSWQYIEWLNRVELNKQLTQITANITKGDKAREEQDAAKIDTANQAKLLSAAFLVVLRDKDGHSAVEGTAWAVGPKLLATNAHITEARAKALESGGTMFVRAPGKNGHEYLVTEHKTHPGYYAFSKFIKDSDIMIANINANSAAPGQGIEALAYDVGLLSIEEKLPADAILEVAPLEDLKAMNVGMPLASAGYPCEWIVNCEVQTIAATPEMHFGNVSALTDYFNLPADAAQTYFVHHSIAITGGSSGSPIIGLSGRVVALVNAANFLADSQGNRIPNAVLVNYAQRADILADLIAGKADAAVARDRAYWDTQLAEFKRGIDVVIPLILDSDKPSGPNANVKPVLVSEEKSVLAASDMRNDQPTRYRAKQHALSLKGGVGYVIIAYAEGKTPITLYLADKANNVLAQDVGKIWYPSVPYNPSQDGDFFAYVEGPDSDTNYVFRLYRWDAPANAAAAESKSTQMHGPAIIYKPIPGSTN
ncbi:MAG: trypsin-like peptidase domain-containing protein [Beijerinckiaceae bacterium]